MHRVLAVFLLVFALATPARAQPTDPDIAALIGAMRSGDAAAMAAASERLEVRLDAGRGPVGQDATGVFYVMGLAAFRTGDLESGARLLGRATEAARREGYWARPEGFEVRYEHVSSLMVLDRYGEAAPLALELSRDIREAGLFAAQIGRNAEIAVGQTMQELERYEEAEAAWRHVLASAEASDPPDLWHQRLALLGLTHTLWATDRAEEALPYAQRAADIALASADPNSEEGLTARLQYALAIEHAARLDEARRAIGEVLADAETHLPGGHDVRLAAQAALTRIEKAVGQYADFRNERRTRIEDLVTHGAAEERLIALEELAKVHFAETDLAAYEATLRAIIEHVDANPALSPARKAVAMVGLADLRIADRMDFPGAYALLSDALEILRSTLGRDHLETLRAEAEFLSYRRSEARFADSLRDIGRDIVFSTGDPEAASYSKADLDLLGRLAAAEAADDPARGFIAALNHANALTEARRFDEALAIIGAQKAVVNATGTLPGGRQMAVWLRHELSEARGRVHLAAGDFAAAVAVFDAGVPDLMAMLQEARWAAAVGGAQEFHRFAQLYGKTFATSAWRAGNGGTGTDVFAAGFEAAQLAGYGPAAAAVSRASARKAAGDPDLVALLGEFDSLTNFAIGPGTSREARDARAARLSAIQTEIDLRHSDYFALQVPSPVPLDTVIGGEGTAPLLEADEALILVLPMVPDQQSANEIDGLVLAVTREGTAWAELPLASLDLIVDIGRLHLTLDPGRDTSAQYASLRAPMSALDAPAPAAAPFDFEAAARLHEALFGTEEVAALIDKKDHWTIVPFGAALTLPYAALVTDDPGGPAVRSADALRQVTWLGHEKALTIVPSVNALVDLRSRARSTPPRSNPTYIAFGDPAFGGPESRPLLTADAALARSGSDRAAGLRALPRLPGTAREVSALAKLFGAGTDAVALGEDASETRLRSLERSGALAGADIVHFATHGLLSGAFSGLAEPALALTPQGAGATEDTDGLLTASEAARLDLDADWVILSACDTAGREGAFGDGLGGLAQGFLAAGARALLVSHWRVDDTAAERLTTRTVTETMGGASKADALRRAMRELAADRSRDASGLPNAHPSVWAPFVLIGG